MVASALGARRRTVGALAILTTGNDPDLPASTFLVIPSASSTAPADRRASLYAHSGFVRGSVETAGPPAPKLRPSDPAIAMRVAPPGLLIVRLRRSNQ
jgi:hypothetical protein